MPNGPIPIFRVQYRLSRVFNGGQQFQTYHRIIVLSMYGSQANARFMEGFGAFKFIVEAYLSTYEFRKQTSVPVMLQDFDRFKVIGSEMNDPQLRSWLALVTVPAGFKINEEQDVFCVTLRDIDASHGLEIEAYNSASAGTNTNIEFYDRDVRSIGGQRNMLETRERINPSPVPEKIGEPLLKEIMIV